MSCVGGKMGRWFSPVRSVDRISAAVPEPDQVSKSPSSQTPSGGASKPRYAGDPTLEELERRKVEFTYDLFVKAGASFEQRCTELLRIADSLSRQTDRWAAFYRETLARGGIVDQLFAGSELRQRFDASEAAAELQEMIAAMRSGDQSRNDSTEPTRTVTIRVPASLHETLVAEAEAASLSINHICISKLIRPLDPRMIPEPKEKLRGRKPGPQTNRDAPSRDVSGRNSSSRDVSGREASSRDVPGR